MGRPRANARRTTSKATVGSEGRASGIVRSSAPRQAQLEKLEKQHERLLRSIHNRKGKLDLLREVSDAVMSELLPTLQPIRTEMEALVSETRRLLEGLFSAHSPLRQRERRRVENLYWSFVLSLPFDLQMQTHPAADEEQDSEDDFDFDFDFDDDDDYDAGHGDTDGPGDPRGRMPEGEHGYSAPRPTGATADALRATFKRLVSKLHPDKVRDEGLKAERTVALKEVTQAYEAQDLAALLDLERSLLQDLAAEVGTDPLAMRIERLKRSNAELRRQLAELSDQQEHLRHSIPFTLDLRAPKRLRHQADQQMTEFLEELRGELAGLREVRTHVEAFAKKPSSLAQLEAAFRATLRGEAGVIDADELLDDELLDMVVEQVFGANAPPPRPSRPSKKRKRKNKRRKNR